MKKFALWSVLILFALAACGSGQEVIVVIVTATPEPTLAATPTPAAEGTATADAASQVTTKQDLNMRAGDSTAYDVMTVIPGGESVQVIGINQAGTWYQVLYHEAVGWISVGFTNGEPPTGLPVASAPPAPTSSGGGSDSGGGGDSNYSFTLDLSNDGESNTVSSELTPGDTDYVTVKFEGLGGSIDTGHLRVQLYCSAGEDEVELSESISRSNHSNECNGDWDYQIEESDSELVIGMTLPSGFNENVDWTMTVEVNT
jgi:hypothetical protein